MNITGSLQIRNGTYYMMLRVPRGDGTYMQKAKTTKIKVQGKNERETRRNKLEAEKMLAQWSDDLRTRSTRCFPKQANPRYHSVIIAVLPLDRRAYC